MMTVLVAGATGNVGSKVVQELQNQDVTVHAFVRDPLKAAEKLGDDVELIVGDFSDAQSVQRAMDGVDELLLTSADGPDKVAYEIGVIDAAIDAGVRRIVKLSTLNAESGSPLPPFDWHGRIEEHLKRSGVPSVILQSNFYMTNLLASVDSIKQAGKLVAPAGDGRISMIDPLDVAAVAALALTDDKQVGTTHVLTGPAAITYSDVARELSQATGRPVDYVNVPDEAMRQGLVATGMPDWLVTHLVALFGIIRRGALEQTTDTVRLLTGRDPRPFAQFARDHAEIFGA